MLNDHKVAEEFKRVIKRELQDEVDAKPDRQSNVIMLCVVYDRPKKARPLGGGIIFHHVYVRRCATRDLRFYFGRNPVLVVASDRTGPNRLRH